MANVAVDGAVVVHVTAWQSASARRSCGLGVVSQRVGDGEFLFWTTLDDLLGLDLFWSRVSFGSIRFAFGRLRHALGVAVGGLWVLPVSLPV